MQQVIRGQTMETQVAGLLVTTSLPQVLPAVLIRFLRQLRRPIIVLGTTVLLRIVLVLAEMMVAWLGQALAARSLVPFRVVDLARLLLTSAQAIPAIPMFTLAAVSSV